MAIKTKRPKRVAQPVRGAIPDADEVAAAANDGEDKESQPVNSERHEKLLKELREDYRYCLDFWREPHEEGATDMRYVAGDPWDPSERDEREENGRPCISLDEIGQYLNQAINNLRQNKRAIKVNPKGSGATDKDAEMRAAIIRGVEYQSNAQAAYTTAFEGAINCGFGFFRLVTEYISEEGFERQPRIKRIPNALTVLMDPNAKEADFSDSEIAFVTDITRASDFARRWPKAQKRSFSAEDQAIAPDFIKGENIVTAEYWRVEREQRRKMLVRGKGRDRNARKVFGDELGKGELENLTVLDERTVTRKKVMQYITNGVEILEENEWDGSWIPIIGVFGKELYLSDGGQTRRVFMSMVRLARNPQMLHAYLCSQQIEEAGMSPRSPIMLWEGQEMADAEAWKYLNKVPRAYVKLKMVTDPVTGAPMPLPERHPFTPNFEGYELVKESARRSIQAAMGLMPQTTATQRRNEKSGIALERMEQQEQVGSFHFTDNFDRALENAGRQLNELITKVMDTPRQVGIRKTDDSHALLMVAAGEHAGQLGQDNDYLVTDRGEFDVTISTGPAMQSEREEMSAFVDKLLENLDSLPVAPEVKAALLSRAVKMKNLGHMGDEISKLLDPQGDGEPIPPQAMAALQKAKQEAQAVNAYAKNLEQKNQQLEFEKAAKSVEMAYRESIEKMKIEAQVASAEITTKAQSLSERLDLVGDLLKQFHTQAHERGLQAEEHAHAADQADQAAQTQAALQQQQAEQQQPQT